MILQFPQANERAGCGVKERIQACRRRLREGRARQRSRPDVATPDENYSAAGASAVYPPEHLRPELSANILVTAEVCWLEERRARPRKRLQEEAIRA